MINITVESALKALDDLVEEYGADHVYNAAYSEYGPDCLYAKEVEGVAKPDCIAGHVLVRHGFAAERLLFLTDAEGVWVNPYAVKTIDENLRDMQQKELLTFEPGVPELLRDAQLDQDYGLSWGDAVKHAKREHFRRQG